MPQATGGIETMKEIILLKIGKKYNICDRIIFALIQCDIREARKISSILEISLMNLSQSHWQNYTIMV